MHYSRTFLNIENIDKAATACEFAYAPPEDYYHETLFHSYQLGIALQLVQYESSDAVQDLTHSENLYYTEDIDRVCSTDEI